MLCMTGYKEYRVMGKECKNAKKMERTVLFGILCSEHALSV